jgi:hypothetical protein
MLGSQPACCNLSTSIAAQFESWARPARVTSWRTLSQLSRVICLRKHHKRHNPHKYRLKREFRIPSQEQSVTNAKTASDPHKHCFVTDMTLSGGILNRAAKTWRSRISSRQSAALSIPSLNPTAHSVVPNALELAPTSHARRCANYHAKPVLTPCPPRYRTGDSISLYTGYTGNALTRNTGVAIDPSGDVWLANNLAEYAP